MYLLTKVLAFYFRLIAQKACKTTSNSSQEYNWATKYKENVCQALHWYIANLYNNMNVSFSSSFVLQGFLGVGASRLVWPESWNSDISKYIMPVLKHMIAINSWPV